MAFTTSKNLRSSSGLFCETILNGPVSVPGTPFGAFRITDKRLSDTVPDVRQEMKSVTIRESFAFIVPVTNWARAPLSSARRFCFTSIVQHEPCRFLCPLVLLRSNAWHRNRKEQMANTAIAPFPRWSRRRQWFREHIIDRKKWKRTGTWLAMSFLCSYNRPGQYARGRISLVKFFAMNKALHFFSFSIFLKAFGTHRIPHFREVIVLQEMLAYPCEFPVFCFINLIIFPCS